VDEVLDSGNPEWVEYDFNSKVLLASICMLHVQMGRKWFE
jgi:hypothetical protein